MPSRSKQDGMTSSMSVRHGTGSGAFTSTPAAASPAALLSLLYSAACLCCLHSIA